MFPGRFPNVPESMWNFGWNPQTMGLQGQFCGGDLMNQQSQAESQAQTQAQISALREQNAILNQQLNSQAQSHIQHLQQLLPFHQPPQPVQAPSIPSTPQPSGPQAPDPPTPVTTPATQSGPTPSFNPDEMLQQMKNTVESSLQALVEKTQERQTNQPPTPLPPACLHKTSANIHHLVNIHCHDNAPLAGLVLIATTLHHGDTTNVRSPFIEVLVVDAHPDDPVAHHDLDPLPGMFPLKGKNLGNQAGDNPLLSDLLLHDIEKNDIEPRITNNHGNNPTRRRLFKLHLGGTTHSPHPTLIPKHDPIPP